MAEKKKLSVAPSAAKITDKQRAILQENAWKPGQSGNPKGRPKGSRNKLGEDFIKALHNDFTEHGVEAIANVREKRPADYLKVIAQLLPKDVNLNVNDLSDQSDDAILARIKQLDAALGPIIARIDQGAPGPDAGTIRPQTIQ